MPGLIIFGRRWMVGSDDLVIPFSIAFVLRFLWMATLCVMIGYYHFLDHTHDDNKAFSETLTTNVCETMFDYYAGGYIILLFATNILEMTISCVSGKGTIMEESPRRLLPHMLYIRLCFAIIEVVWLSVGIKWMFIDTRGCEYLESEVSLNVGKGVVIFNWLFVILTVFIVYCSFDSAGRTWVQMERARATLNVDVVDGARNKISEKYGQSWEGCFKYCFCSTGIDQDENVYSFIGRTLSDYFGDLNVVPSDLAAGLVLLRKKQKKRERMELYSAIKEDEYDSKGLDPSVLRYQRTKNSRPLCLDDKTELRIFCDVVHYMRYALAAYSWPIYMKSNMMCGCCKLCPGFVCCTSCRNPEDIVVEDDNCCGCSFAALKKIVDYENVDFIHVTYNVKLYETPFYVAVDHNKKSVVVTVRGTLSLHDIVTDLMVEAEKLPVDGGDPNWFGHKGMIKAAVYIKNALEANGILEKAFNSDPERGTKQYKLILVGHSLGAGTAAILAFLLRPQYPDLFCYSYSPPGALLSLVAAKYAYDFVISVVVGKDMIPRSSLYTLEDLRNNIMHVISRSNKPKWKIMRRCVCQCVLCCGTCDPRMYKKSNQYDLEAVESMRAPTNRQSSTPRFYPPGRIIHVAKTQSHTRHFRTKKVVFEPFWAGTEDFQTILISSLMWADHMPDFVLFALENCLPKGLHKTLLNSNSDEIFSTPIATPTLPQKIVEVTVAENVQESSFLRDSRTSEDSAASGSKDSRSTTSLDNDDWNLLKEVELVLVHPSEGLTRECESTSPAPLVRPESGLYDSELDEDDKRRISSQWKEYNLDSVKDKEQESIYFTPQTTPPPTHAELNQSPVTITLSRAESLPTVRSSSSSIQHIGSGSLTDISTLLPPPKPPRSDASGETLDSSMGLAPPKPPRTFTYTLPSDEEKTFFEELTELSQRTEEMLMNDSKDSVFESEESTQVESEPNNRECLALNGSFPSLKLTTYITRPPRNISLSVPYQISKSYSELEPSPCSTSWPYGSFKFLNGSPKDIEEIECKPREKSHSFSFQGEKPSSSKVDLTKLKNVFPFRYNKHMKICDIDIGEPLTPETPSDEDWDRVNSEGVKLLPMTSTPYSQLDSESEQGTPSTPCKGLGRLFLETTL